MAQSIPLVDIEASILSDYRARGLSWSDGKIATQIRAETKLPIGFNVAAQATTTRGAPLHGGADAALMLEANYTQSFGLWDWQTGIIAHSFPGGHGTQNYIEVETGTGLSLGPAQARLTASYAPSQKALGGSNFHSRASMSTAIIGTPLTAFAQLGWSAGSTRDDKRPNRLRPGGNYTDWKIGAEYTHNNVVLGIAYSATSLTKQKISDRYGDAALPDLSYGAAALFSAHYRF